MVSPESINGNVDMIENEITPGKSGSIIIEAINTIRRNKKRHDELHIWISQQRIAQLKYSSTLIDTRLSTLTIDGKLEIKYPLGKTSYWVKGNNALESCKSKTLENNPKTPT